MWNWNFTFVIFIVWLSNWVCAGNREKSRRKSSDRWKKTYLRAQLLICEGVFEHFSSFSSLTSVYFFWFQIWQINKYFHTCLSKWIKKNMSISRAAHLWGLFLSILAYLAHLACSFSLILNRIDKIMFWCKHANTRKHVIAGHLVEWFWVF